MRSARGHKPAISARCGPLWHKSLLNLGLEGGYLCLLELRHLGGLGVELPLLDLGTHQSIVVWQSATVKPSQIEIRADGGSPGLVTRHLGRTIVGQ